MTPRAISPCARRLAPTASGNRLISHATTSARIASADPFAGDAPRSTAEAVAKQAHRARRAHERRAHGGRHTGRSEAAPARGDDDREDEGDEEDDRDVVAERTAVQTAEARGDGVEEPGEHRGLFIDSRGAG